jgi:hypothetical protein
VSIDLSGDSVETLSPRSPIPYFLRFREPWNMEGRLQQTEGNKAKRGNDRLVAFFYAKSSQGVLAVLATPPSRSRGTVSHACSRPGSASRVWWSARISWYADHQARRDWVDIFRRFEKFGGFGISSLLSSLLAPKEGKDPNWRRDASKYAHSSLSAISPAFCGSTPHRWHVLGTGGLPRM